MTIEEIEHKARLILADDNERKFRFTEEDIFRAIKDAAIAVRTLRPESCYVRGRLVDLCLVQMKNSEKSETSANAPAGETVAKPSDKSELIIPFEIPDPLDPVAFRKLQINMEDQWAEALPYHVAYAMKLTELTESSKTNLAQYFHTKFLERLKLK